MNEVPTTPVRLILGQAQQREQNSENCSQERNPRTFNSEPDSSFNSPGSSQFVIHPHEPLEKEKDEKQDLDRSIDYGRSSALNNKNNANPLENIDINKMFDDKKSDSGTNDDKGGASTSDKHVLALNYSPIRVEMNSSEKRSDKNVDVDENDKESSHINKKLKLQLESVPDLKQSSTKDIINDKEEIMSSPMAIDMIETNISPNKFIINDGVERNDSFNINTDTLKLENDINEKQQEEDFIKSNSNNVVNIDNAYKEKEDEENDITNSHINRLTPLYETSARESNSNEEGRNGYDDDNQLDIRHDNFQIVAKRNEELTDQIYHLNQMLNSLISKNESLSFQYEKLNKNHQLLIDSTNEKLDKLNTERESDIAKVEKFKKRIKELNTEIKVLNSNQKILQEKFDASITEVNHIKGEHENTVNTLQQNEKILNDKNVELENMKAELKGNNDKLSEYETTLNDLNSRIVQLNDKIESTDIVLKSKENELDNLKLSLKETLSISKDFNDSDLIAQINELISTKNNLQQKMDDLNNLNDDNLKVVQDKLIKNEETLKLKEAEIDSLNSEMDELKKQITTKDDEFKMWQSKYETVEDEAKIRNAEVTELNGDIEDLKESKLHLEETITELENKVHKLENECELEKQKFEKTSLELESLQLKNSNIQAEHIKELENLHENLISLQNELKISSDRITTLTKENEVLMEQNNNNNNSVTLSNDQKDRDDEKIKSLGKQVQDWKEKYEAKEKDTNKRLKLLAEDLYIQYSSKHEQKVKLLKKGYENKYQNKFDQLNLENKTLSEEIEQLNKQLSSEREEKQELLKLLENEKK
ncbi:BMC_2a_G0051030.mRNA.1.CDS.1 [Saccharomyces cerevisiae]|nr:Slk19p [Saccharomyces cerevisiae YJM1447]CAI4721093.1 BMC_2a_G0051030.mRNA.1.CDS.1 [Saccharomyces cerevisiae]CAI4728185.1 BMB_G0050990.mRNA.1.CDS.1 [Saccharomyces cerevisiae]CAI7305065.1 BMC_2a_G0051030.mRNA.1.CDS.1 [Saccharomyces cerevisiae]CAI7307864.1 BMB_G0050990.mRNA.1.CDS.1 [Saccharomyces cerevisiae]